MKFNPNSEKRKDKKRRNIYLCLILSAAAVMLISAAIAIRGRVYDEMGEYKALAVKAHGSSNSRIDFETLSGENSDICGWIYQEGTGIDLPLVQGKNNRFYRKHSFSGKSSSLGCPFVDKENSKDFTDKNTVIYAGELFSSLFGYEEQEYYELLPSMKLYIPEAEITVIIFAGIKTNEPYSLIKTEFANIDDFTQYIDWIKEYSDFTSSAEVNKSDRIITICAEDKEQSYVVFGYLAAI